MNDKELLSFLQICKERSITKAAKALYISPQGLSKIIKNLENELGTMLFVRTPGGMELTNSGAALQQHAERILAQYDLLKSDIQSVKKQENGTVRLLSAYGILRLLGPECVMQFRESYKDIDFSYMEYPDLQVEQRFDNAEGDLAFSIGPFDEDKYHITPIKTFPIKLLVNREHSLSKRQTVGIEDLKGEAIYIESKEFKINQLIRKKCATAGFEPNIVFETSGFSLCHKMCKQNKGISVTVDFISKDMKEEEIIMIPFHDGPYEWSACMLTRKHENIPESVKLFQNFVLQWLGAAR